MEVQLFDSELKVMDVLWREGPCTAKHVCELLKDEVGWNVNTTRTIIKRCIEKGAIERTEPHFMCSALVSREEVQQDAADELIDKVFDGSADKLFASLLGGRRVSREQLEHMRRMIDEMD